MKIKLILPFILVLLTIAGNTVAQTQIIAHRGYWDCEGSAQNSIAALEKAQTAGIYGSEFDVYITADDRLVVNHDDTICGIRIETATYEQIVNCKLSNGEVIPTLESYLIAGKKDPSTKLILEIKPHQEVVNENRAVKAILAMVDKYAVQEQVEYISFSMNICKELIRQDEKAKVSYLRGEVSPEELKELGFWGLDYHYSILYKKPSWIAKAKELGLKVNVWTVNDPDMLKWLKEQGVDFITTDKPVEFLDRLNVVAGY